MKTTLTLLMLSIFSNHSIAPYKKQPNIHFDTDFLQAVDHWVVFTKLSVWSNEIKPGRKGKHSAKKTVANTRKINAKTNG